MRRSRDPGTRSMQPFRLPTTATASVVLVVAAVSAALLPACTDPDPAESASGLDRTEFIEVMVALRDAKLDLEKQDSVPEGRFEALRDSILTAHGVEGAQLYAFVNAHPDLEYQEALWDSINQRLKRPLRAPDVNGRGSALPDTAEELQQPSEPGGIQQSRPDRR